MQQKEKRNTKNRASDLVKPATYAKLRGLNRSTISRQVAQGKIPVHGGLIDPAEADRARHNNLDLLRGRRKAATADTSRHEWHEGEERDYVAWKVCKSARETFAEVFAAADPDEVDDDGRLFHLRVFGTVIVSWMLESWLEDFLKFAPKLPRIAWEHFGDRADEARKLGKVHAKELGSKTL